MIIEFPDVPGKRFEVPDNANSDQLQELYNTVSQGRAASAVSGAGQSFTAGIGSSISGLGRLLGGFTGGEPAERRAERAAASTMGEPVRPPTVQEQAAELAANPIYQFGRQITTGAEEAYPTNPLYRGEAIQSLAEGLGSTASNIPIGLVGGPLAAGAAYGLGAGESVAQDIGQKIDARIAEALSKGDTATAAELERSKFAAQQKLFAATAPIGAITGAATGVAGRVIPLSKIVANKTAENILSSALGKAGGKVVGKAVTAGVKGGVGEATQESLEQIGQNVAEKILVDKNAPIMEGVLPAGGVGGGVGALIGGAAGLVGGGRVVSRARRMAERAVPAPTITPAPENVMPTAGIETGFQPETPMEAIPPAPTPAAATVVTAAAAPVVKEAPILSFQPEEETKAAPSPTEVAAPVPVPAAAPGATPALPTAPSPLTDPFANVSDQEILASSAGVAAPETAVAPATEAAAAPVTEAAAAPAPTPETIAAPAPEAAALGIPTESTLAGPAVGAAPTTTTTTEQNAYQEQGGMGLPGGEQTGGAPQDAARQAGQVQKLAPAGGAAPQEGEVKAPLGAQETLKGKHLVAVLADDGTLKVHIFDNEDQAGLFHGQVRSGGGIKKIGRSKGTGKLTIQDVFDRSTKQFGTSPEIVRHYGESAVQSPIQAETQIQQQVSSVAETEGKRSAKEIKNELVSRVQDAFEKAPSQVSLQGKLPGRVTIQIPQDGTFDIVNTKEALGVVLQNAKRMSTKTVEEPESAFKKLRPTGNIPADVWIESSMPTHDVSVRAIEDGNVIEQKRKGALANIPGLENLNLYLTSDGKTFTITEPRTGAAVGFGDTIAKAKSDAVERLKPRLNEVGKLIEEKIKSEGERTAPTPIQPTTTSQKLVSTLEGLKADLSQTSGLQTGGLAGFNLIRNAAIDVAIVAVKAGAKIADAINAAVKHIRDNYKGDFDEAKFRNEVAAALMPRETTDTTEVGGKTVNIKSRPVTYSPTEQMPALLSMADEAGLKYSIENGVLVPTPGINQDEAGRKLLEIFRNRMADATASSQVDLMGAAINSLRGTLANSPAFSPNLRDEMFVAGQSVASYAGRTLNALALTAQQIGDIARDVRRELISVWYGDFNGNTVGQFMDSVRRGVKEALPDSEIDQVAQTTPNVTQKLFDDNFREVGGRVFRGVQARLKPKKKTKLATKEQAAKDAEAIQQIVENAVKNGVKVPPSQPGLTALQKLQIMLKPETAGQIQVAIEEAVAEAEFNAGWKIEMKRAEKLGEEELQIRKEQKANGEMPPLDAIEEGMQLPEYAHWSQIQEDFLRYSPTTVKLAQQAIRGEVSGVRLVAPGERTAPKAPNTKVKLNLNNLIQQPEAEIKRALAERMQVFEDAMADATPEAKMRVLQMIKFELDLELQFARNRLAKTLAARPDVRLGPAQARTETEKLAQQASNIDKLSAAVRAGFLNVIQGDMSMKRIVQNLVPSVSDLAKAVRDTPLSKQLDLGKQFAAQIVAKMGVNEDQAEAAGATLAKAYQAKFDVARQQALDRATKALLPRQDELGMRTPVWKKIERFVRAGGMDSSEAIRIMAESAGWKMPSEAEIDRMRALSEDEAGMREVSDADRAKGITTEAEKAAITATQRAKVVSEMKTRWSRMTNPVWGMHTKVRENRARAAGEYLSANILLTPGFLGKQGIDVATQIAGHIPTAAIGAELTRWQNSKSPNRNAEFFTNVATTLKDAFEMNVKAFNAALSESKMAFRGISGRDSVESIHTGVRSLERLKMYADEQMAKGNTALAAVIYTAALARFSYRFASALDTIGGRTAEAQKMYQDIVTQLLDNGMTRDQARAKAGEIMGDVMAEKRLADSVVQLFGVPESERNAAAWNLVTARQYLRMQDAGLNPEEQKKANSTYREIIGWNAQEQGGPGMVVASPFRGFNSAMAKMGIPFQVPFANAVAIGTNRALTWAGLGFFPSVFEGSPWYGTESDPAMRRTLQNQRKAEAAAGIAALAVFAPIISAGLMNIIGDWPDDKDEKAMWERTGRRPNTIEVAGPGGNTVRISMSTGPIALIRPWLSAYAATRDANLKRQKRDEAAKATADKKGLEFEAPPITDTEISATFLYSLFKALSGTRTTSGMISQYAPDGAGIERGMLKSVTTSVAPFIPFQPMLRQAGQMAGANIDPKRADVVDYIFPTPWSGNNRLNFFGDPIRNVSDMDRIVSILTGGSGMPVRNEKDKAYQMLLKAGWLPNEISGSTFYTINDKRRQLTDEEYRNINLQYGRMMKSEISQLDPTETPETLAKQMSVISRNARKEALRNAGVQISR